MSGKNEQRSGSAKKPEKRKGEDFGTDSGVDAPGGSKRKKSTRKEETGATESGEEDKGAKM